MIKESYIIEKNKKDIEDRLLEIIERKREDFTEPLFSDFNFVLESVDFLNYNEYFKMCYELIDPKFYNNMFVVCELLDNLRVRNNIEGTYYVLKNVKYETWYDETFLHNVVCSDIRALEFIPDELKTNQVIMNSFYQSPRQVNFEEEKYYMKYLYIINLIPSSFWSNNEYVNELITYLNNLKKYIGIKDQIDMIIKKIINVVNN